MTETYFKRTIQMVSVLIINDGQVGYIESFLDNDQWHQSCKASIQGLDTVYHNH